jgi:hypothetical protein
VLKVSHGDSDRFFEILDRVSSVLTVLTSHRVGAIRAYSDWNIIESLQVYLTPPENKSSHDIHVKNLPISLFQLFSNIMMLDEGKKHSLSSEFLRRALDKLVDLRHALIAISSLDIHDNPKPSIANSSNTPVILPSLSRDRSDATLLLKVINSLHPYSHSKYGRAKDFIMSRRYELISLCHEILMGNLQINYSFINETLVNSVDDITHRKTVAVSKGLVMVRADELIVQVIRTLSVLSVDVMSFISHCESLDLVTMISHELYLFADKYPDLVIELYLNMIDHIASAPTSSYLIKYMQLLRKPLLIASYVYPRYEPLVRNCLWMISDIYSGLGERFHRIPFSQLANNNSSNGSNSTNSGDSSVIHSRVSFTEGNQTDHTTSDTDDRLRLPSISISKGDNLKNNIEKLNNRRGSMNQCLKEAKDPYSYDDNVCEISRISAKSKKLQEFIENRKISYGYKIKPKKVLTHTAKVTKLDPLGKEPKRIDLNAKRVIDANINAADSDMLIVCVEDIPELLLTRPTLPSRMKKSMPEV